MLIDLFLLVVLSAALAWSSTASSKSKVSGALGSPSFDRLDQPCVMEPRIIREHARRF